MLLSAPSGFVGQTVRISATASGTLFHQFVGIEPATLLLRTSNDLEISCVP